MRALRQISWAQPSLYRDFALLSAAVFFVLLMVSGWVTYTTYQEHSDKIASELEKEALRIDHALSGEMESANYMLSSLGRQIVIDSNHDYTKLAQSLKSFDNKGYIYTIFSWTDVNQKMVVSSNKGVLEEAVDISDRDFIQQSALDSWKMHIGRSIEGRVSGRWVIPAGMGITDYTGKFLGIISLSLDIKILTDKIKDSVKRDGISFAIVSKSLIPISEVSDDKSFITDDFTKKLVDIDLSKNHSGLIAKGNLLWGTGSYAYYRVSDNYPYIILMGYDTNYGDGEVRVLLWSRLFQLLIIALFLVFFLWVVRVRVIKPVLDITNMVAGITKGEKFKPRTKTGSVEIEALVAQIRHLSEYIDETKRIQDELKNKIFLLRKSKETAEINLRSKSDFLAYIAQEMRMPLNNIIGFSQVLKDQIYGAIENRKYRQYASDIFTTGNQLIVKIQDVLLHSKLETGYIDLQEKSFDISNAISASLRNMADKLQANKISVKTNIHDNLPHLMADEFRVQQIINNVLLALLDSVVPESFITIDAKIISEQRDKKLLAIEIGISEQTRSANDLLMLSEKHFALMYHHETVGIESPEIIDLRIELARLLMILHGGVLCTELLHDKIDNVILFFPNSRLVFDYV